MNRRVALYLLTALTILALPNLADAQGAFQPKSTVKFIVPFGSSKPVVGRPLVGSTVIGMSVAASYTPLPLTSL